MQNTKIINIILGTILIVAIAGMLIVIKSPTGMIVPGTPVQKPMLTGAPADYWKDIELKDYIYEFFETEKFYFPENTCGRIAKELCGSINNIKTTGIEEFSAGNSQRFKTMIFKDYNELGQITMIKGIKNPENAKINITLRKAVVTINGWQETMDMQIQLQGRKTENSIKFEKGKIKALDFECEFG